MLFRLSAQERVLNDSLPMSISNMSQSQVSHPPLLLMHGRPQGMWTVQQAHRIVRAPDPSDGRLNQHVTTTRVVVELGRWVLLPCHCPLNDDEGEAISAGWKGVHDNFLDLSETSVPLKNREYVLLNLRRRQVVPGDFSLFLRRPQLHDQGNYTCYCYSITPPMNVEGIVQPATVHEIHVVTLIVRTASDYVNSTIVAMFDLPQSGETFFSSSVPNSMSLPSTPSGQLVFSPVVPLLSTTPPSMSFSVTTAVLRAGVGGPVYLPCPCTEWNSVSSNPPVWVDNHDVEILLIGPKFDAVPLSQRKFSLPGHSAWRGGTGDCTLVLYNAMLSDQGEYRCTYLDPKFQFDTSTHSWKKGYRIHKVKLMLEEPDHTKVIEAIVKAGNNTQQKTTELVTSIVNDRRRISTTQPPGTTISVTTQMTSTIDKTKTIYSTGISAPKDTDATTSMNVSITLGTTVVSVVPGHLTDKSMIGNSPANDSQSPLSEKEAILDDNEENFENLMTLENEFNEVHMTEQCHEIQKRDAGWKAYGFDSSSLEVTDPWAGRNLWYLQLTHSVRTVQQSGDSYLLRIPKPNTWESIMETVPDPLDYACQIWTLNWLLYQQRRAKEWTVSVSKGLFRPQAHCSWIQNLPYVNILDQHENIRTAVPDVLEVVERRASHCFCSNNTNNGQEVYLGISDCDVYGMPLKSLVKWNATVAPTVTFKIPNSEQVKTLALKFLPMPANVTIGIFKDVWWVCGDKAYLFLPYGWTGCCYMATLKLPYEAMVLRKEQKDSETDNHLKRRRREMAKFHNLEAYHWRISLAEKWGIGIFPWYGVTFLADHIDNITYTLQGFANETIKGFGFLSNTQKSHRLTLLKHDMALDYILAQQGGLCVALNLTGDACYTLVPDTSDNLTSVVDALKRIRDAFGPSESAGWSANAWLQDQLGPVGAIIVQILVAALLSLCFLFCFCTVLLTFAKAMIMRWVGVVMPGDNNQMSVITRKPLVTEKEGEKADPVVVEVYPF